MKPKAAAIAKRTITIGSSVIETIAMLPNAWLQRRGANPRKLRRSKYHGKDAIAASAASHCSAAALDELVIIRMGSNPKPHD